MTTNKNIVYDTNKKLFNHSSLQKSISKLHIYRYEHNMNHTLLTENQTRQHVTKVRCQHEIPLFISEDTKSRRLRQS